MNKENFIDLKSDIRSDQEQVKNMLNETSLIDTNIGDFVNDEKKYFSDMKDKYIKDDIEIEGRFMDKISKGIDKSNVVRREKDVDPFNVSWKTYRIVSFILILLSFFFLKFVQDVFVERKASPYIQKIYKVVSVLIIINLCVFLFYRTYFRYISTMKGKNGPIGTRGEKGIPGENSVCDITKKKTATLYREKNRKPVKDIIDTSPNVILNFDPEKQKSKKGWYNIDYLNTKILSPLNKKIGIPCVSGSNNCKLDDNDNNNNGMSNTEYITEIKKKKGELDANKPIIGASINYNKTSNLIQDIKFYSDKNKNHNNKKYKITQFGGKKETKPNRINLHKNTQKENFQCPPNSAVFKLEGMYDNVGLKGLKFYCKDITTGKSVRTYNKDNKKVYGVGYGVEADPANENYLYDKVECQSYNEKEDKKDTELYPTFLSNVKEIYDDTSINSLIFNNCSYYRK